MNKTKAETQAAIEEIAAVCRKHGVYLVGQRIDRPELARIVIMPRDHYLCSMTGSFGYEDITNEVRQDTDLFVTPAIG